MPRFEALIIPNEALERGGVEVLRAAIIEGQLHVTLRRTFEEPDPWGGLLSEVARRVARAYCVGGGRDEREVVLRIHSTFVSESEVRPRKRRPRGGNAARRKAKKRGRGRK
jgi:Domain of unknown function (DUF5076)